MSSKISQEIEHREHLFSEDKGLVEITNLLRQILDDTYELYDQILDDFKNGLYHFSKRQFYVMSLSKRIHEMSIDIVDLIKKISYQSLNSLIRVVLEYTLISSTLANSKNIVSIKYDEWTILNEKKVFYEKYVILSRNNSLSTQDKRIKRSIDTRYNKFKNKYSNINSKIYKKDNGWTYFIDSSTPKVYNTKELYEKFIDNLYFYIQKSHNYVHSSAYTINFDALDSYYNGKITLKHLLHETIVLSTLSIHYISLNIIKVFKKKKYREFKTKIQENVVSLLEIVFKKY